MRKLLLASLALCGFLVGCATGPQVDPQITTTMQQRGVSYAVYNKVSNGQVLDYNDITELVVKKVPANITVGYLRSTRKIYTFSYAQLQALQSAGASPQLLNYLTETEGFYGSPSQKQKDSISKMQKDAYFNTPQYQDEAPFAYNEPVIDDWYDSGYEESLYSPFSFN